MIDRRSILRAGVLGFSGLGLADVLRARAVAGEGGGRPPATCR